MFDWDRDNVIVTGSSDGVVRVSACTCQHDTWCTHTLYTLYGDAT